MRTADFDYTLPADRIAGRPAPRGASRLLVIGDGPSRHHRTSELARLLRAGDVVVVNNTRVIPARLYATRSATGGRVELLLVEEVGPRRWRALARPARRLVPGVRLDIDETVHATVVTAPEDGVVTVELSEPADRFLDRLGHVPLPPYLGRDDEPADRERYQTVYASVPGAIAAPTAGLHFGEHELAALREAGIDVVEITLHVGIGTFKPVSAEVVESHRMEEERYAIGEDAARRIATARREGRRIVAVGTTVVRALESAIADHGALEAAVGRTRLFIVPGFEFRCVDALVTNFHLPRSTLLMLVCAFGGTQRVLAAYAEAVREGYRFYSYGDAMLLARRP